MKHTVVWIDQEEARVFGVEGDAVEHALVHSPGAHIHRHANEPELRTRNHPDDEHRYFRAVALALEGEGQILIVGPAKTKLHLLRYLQEHHKQLEQRIVGIESADHPSDSQLVAHLRSYFHESLPRRGQAAPSK